jgi:hypothetical protein
MAATCGMSGYTAAKEDPSGAPVSAAAGNATAPSAIGPDGTVAVPNLIHWGVAGAEVECCRPDLVANAGTSEEMNDEFEEFDGPEVCRLHDSAE